MILDGVLHREIDLEELSPEERGHLLRSQDYTEMRDRGAPGPGTTGPGILDTGASFDEPGGHGQVQEGHSSAVRAEVCLLNGMLCELEGMRLPERRLPYVH